jgi:hypothetical protein
MYEFEVGKDEDKSFVGQATCCRDHLGECICSHYACASAILWRVHAWIRFFVVVGASHALDSQHARSAFIRAEHQRDVRLLFHLSPSEYLAQLMWCRG